MRGYPSREVVSRSVHGEEINFVATNDRLQERVESACNEEHIIEKLTGVGEDNRVLWDVGACFGLHTFVSAPSYDHVVSFEPMPTNRSVICDNGNINNFDNVYVEPSALADESGEVAFAIRESNEPGFARHSIVADGYDKEYVITVPQERGDNLDHPAPNVVKIDVEGAEGLVLEGMEETLSRPECRHVILETHEPNPVQPSHEDFGYTENDLRTLLEDAGFEVETLEKRYHLYGRKP